ncbi:MAG TPA: PAS domain S-box protein [Chitinispirillaceae bacterium]|nr:PAS domain S-box protein [Chitinispirillaceae bacterium]
MQSKQCSPLDHMQLRFTLNTLNATVSVQDRDLQYTEIYNPNSGFLSENAIGKRDEDVVPPEEAVLLTKIKQAVINSGVGNVTEVKISINGVPNYYSLAIKPIMGKMGEILGLTCVSVDITKQKRLERELNESEERFHTLFYNSSVANFLLVDDICIDCNQALLTLMRCTREEIVGHNLIEFSPEFQADGLRSKDKAAGFLSGPVAPRNMKFEWVHQRPDGTEFWAEVVGRTGSMGGKTAYFVSLRNITEYKQAEEEQRQNRNMLDKILNTIPQSVFWKDCNSRYLGCNLQFAHDVGLTDPANIVGKTDFDLPWPKEDAEAYITDDRFVMDHNLLKSHIIEPLVQADGTQIWIETSKMPLTDELGNVYGTIGIYEDITERKKVTEALNNAQKLESLGLLAGGIAHDFNNLLGGIYGYMDMAHESTTDQKLRQYITKAMNTIDRGRHLTQQLLTFSKGGTPIKSVAPLFPYVREIAQFALSGSNVSCDFDVAENLYACNFDKNQIAQVIDNIIINSKQAMPDGGKINISARNITIAKGHHVTLKNGEYVRISIRDHGIGMPKEILPRIFDPFYTTKATGHGLGLATCYSIINRHDGCIDVESEPGKGSTFHVFLPATSDVSDTAEVKSKSIHKGSGTFIIMDDEAVILETIACILESFGYNVIKTVNGQEAVDVLSSEIAAKRNVTAMLFDLTIPGGMGGKEAINEIRKISTGIPVFVSSGYADDPVMANPKEYGFFASICKPFRKSELSDMLNRHIKDLSIKGF